jgi:uncharacterized protein YeaO (DUF488 family)
MAVHVIRLGSPRQAGEGPRIGTVRRPPRGVPKAQFAAQGWYDTWFPLLAPSAEAVKQAQAAQTPAAWQAFLRRYRREMAAPEPAQAIGLLAVLSRGSDFAVGCYCSDEAHCHRSVLRQLLAEAGATMA